MRWLCSLMCWLPAVALGQATMVDVQTDVQVEVQQGATGAGGSQQPGGGHGGAPGSAPGGEPGAPADTSSDPPAAEPPRAVLPLAHQPRLSVSYTPQGDILTGDVVTLTIAADALRSDDIAVPPEQEFTPFEVIDTRVRVEQGQDRTVHYFELDLLALEPGQHSVPAVRIRVVTSDGEVGEVTTEPVPLRVGSVLGNEPDAEPKPPTAPVQVFEDDYALYWVGGAIGAILITALLTLLLARWWRRRERKAAPPPPPRPPWELALERLEAARRDRDQALHAGRVMEWVDGVSDTIRVYLGGRYGFEGLESTTDEVVAQLRKRKLIGIAADEVLALLAECDLVKFAKATLDAEQSDRLLGQAFRIVRATSPRAGEAPPSELAAPAAPSPAAAVPVPRAPSPDERWMPKPAEALDSAVAIDPSEQLPPPAPTTLPGFSDPTPQIPKTLGPEDQLVATPRTARPIPDTVPPPLGDATLPETRLLPHPANEEPRRSAPDARPDELPSRDDGGST